jgi:hypothetical protein
MRFYMENGMTRVQYKHFNKDIWRPAKGHVYLRSLWNTAEKPVLAEVHRVEERELKALDEFIAYEMCGEITKCLEEPTSHKGDRVAEGVSRTFP